MIHEEIKEWIEFGAENFVFSARPGVSRATNV
jgi:hypothetical protein